MTKTERQNTNINNKSDDGDGQQPPLRRGVGAVASRIRLTDRDKQLMGLLSIVRYLSEEQIGALSFSSCGPSILRRRLLLLSGVSPKSFRPPFLRRLPYRTFDGDLGTAWALTDRGYQVAEAILGDNVRVPRLDLGPELLHHEVTLNELFVRLAKPNGNFHARARLRDWRWTNSESARLSWSQYDLVAGKPKERLICPDAILDLLVARRRLFLEFEMGTHPIRSTQEERTGATLAKSERYEEYLTGRPRGGEPQETFYSRAHPDGFRPELLFLVQSKSRMENINFALRDWRRKRPNPDLPVRALTLELAVAEMKRHLGEVSSPAKEVQSPRNLGREDVALLREFFRATVSSFRDLRAKARASGEPPPNYPAHADAVKLLLARISTPSMAGRPS